MIWTIIRNGFRGLRRDRAALILSFVLPIAFFSIFAYVFGSMGSQGAARVAVIVVDQDQSPLSARLIEGLRHEASLSIKLTPSPKPGAPAGRGYTADTAEAAVRNGEAPTALIIPSGFGANPIALEPGRPRPLFTLLHDQSDPISAQIVAGMAEKVVMTAFPDAMAAQGMAYFDAAAGGLTAQQRTNIDASLARLRAYQQGQTQHTGATAPSAQADQSPIAISVRDVIGHNRNTPMISFYAAGIGVMFLLFSANSAAGSLIDEAESGALDRMLSARVGMTTLLAGKLLYCALLASLQLVVMFLWGAAVFHLDLFSHLPGFIVMTAATSIAVASFGMLLASLSRTRQQQSAIATLLILVMSALGGSMFPRFLMPEFMRQVGFFTFNAWAIDGFTKVFWRDEPISHLLPQIGVLVGAALAFFALARLFARRWEAA